MLNRLLIISCCALIGIGLGIVEPQAIGQEKAKGKGKKQEVVVQDRVASITSEADLIAILSQDSPAAEKAMACKRLAVYGSEACVPELAKLLSDVQLASWSRIALEAIPGKAPNAALRDAAKALNGRLLTGVVNSLGVRRDTEAVDILASKLKDADLDVASCAAIALGNIGGEAAVKALRDAMPTAPEVVQNAIAEGCVLCAERFMTQGNSSMAIEVYDEVRKVTSLPKQRIVEATRGAILARKKEGVPLLMEQLRSNDKPMFQMGLRAARELPGNEVVTALLAELNQAETERAVLLVQALAEREGNLDLATILGVAAKGPKAIRIAAMNVLSRIGDASCVEKLLSFGVEGDPDLRAPAKAALVAIQDDQVDKKVLEALATAKGSLQQLVVEVVGTRRIEATSQLQTLLSDSNTAIRHAALEALGNTVPQGQLGLLIAQVVSPSKAEDAKAAQVALQTASIRMPDREACAAVLAQAMQGSSIETKVKLLEVLGAVGGTNALAALGAAAKDTETQLKDTSSRLLGDWMTIDAAPVLLDLATTGPADKFQVRAMRGYIRIARQFVMSDAERVAMASKAYTAAKQVPEKKLVVEIMGRYPSLEMLKLAIEATKDADVKMEATQAASAIAQKLGDNAEAKALMSKAGLAIP